MTAPRRLLTERGDHATEMLVAREARDAFPEHDDPSPVFEHGRWWVSCSPCGAQWAVNDADPGPFSFAQVTQGDESCPGGTR